MNEVMSISNREMGAIPISISTSLAIESCLGILPEFETDKPVINDIDMVWINVRTLYRNLMGSVDKLIRPHLTDTDIIEALINELQIIETTFSHQTRGRTTVTFYVCSYSGLARRYPHASLKNPNTQLQKESHALEQIVINGIIDQQPPHDFRVFDMDFDGEQKRVLIITHHAIDLLNRYKFKTLSLLESHTGAVKSPSRWYTKFHDGKEMFNIPFDRMTLQVFGDGVTFVPSSLKTRRFVKEVADKNTWSSITTKDYIVKSIKAERDNVQEAAILKLY
jgi:hypothetical protein